MMNNTQLTEKTEELGGAKEDQPEEKNGNNSTELGETSNSEDSAASKSCGPVNFEPNVEVEGPSGKGLQQFTTNCATIFKIVHNSCFLEQTHESLGGKVVIFVNKEDVFVDQKLVGSTDDLKESLASYMGKPVSCTAREFPSMTSGKPQKTIHQIVCQFHAWIVWCGEKPSEKDLQERQMVKKSKKKKGKAVTVPIHRQPPFVKREKITGGHKISTNCATIVGLEGDRGLLKVSHESLKEDAHIYFVTHTVFTNKKPMHPRETIETRLSQLKNKPFCCSARSLPSWARGKRQKYFKDHKINYLAWLVWYGDKPNKRDKSVDLSQELYRTYHNAPFSMPYKGSGVSVDDMPPWIPTPPWASTSPRPKHNTNNNPKFPIAKRSNQNYNTYGPDPNWYGQEGWYGQDPDLDPNWYGQEGWYGNDSWYGQDPGYPCGVDTYKSEDPRRYKRPPASFGHNYSSYGLESSIYECEQDASSFNFTPDRQSKRFPVDQSTLDSGMGKHGKKTQEPNSGNQSNKKTQGSNLSTQGDISGNKNPQGSKSGTQGMNYPQGSNSGNQGKNITSGASSTGNPANQKPQRACWSYGLPPGYYYGPNA